MTELERRAMSGELDAMVEVLNRGILLPCPKCYSENVMIIGDLEDFQKPVTVEKLENSKNTMIAVRCHGCGITSAAYKLGADKKSALMELLVDWNTRPIPLVGRCKDCTHKAKATVDAKGFLICHASGMEIAEDDYCSYFELKTE